MQWGFNGPDQIVQPREGVEVRVRRGAGVRVRCGGGVEVLVRRGVRVRDKRTHTPPISATFYCTQLALSVRRSVAVQPRVVHLEETSSGTRLDG